MAYLITEVDTDHHEMAKDRVPGTVAQAPSGELREDCRWAVFVVIDDEGDVRVALRPLKSG